MNTQAPKKVYIFFRKGGWYPLELWNDKDAVANALNNPGTIKVETVKGRVVWKAKNQL